MIRLIYKDFDPALWEAVQDFEQLREVFLYLLLKTHGDAQDALDIMRALQGRGYLNPDVDLDEFAERLNAEKLVRREGTDARLVLTDKGVKGLRQASLERVFRDLKAGGASGQHRTPQGGGLMGDALPELREYRFGDELQAIDFNESLLGAMRRAGGTMPAGHVDSAAGRADVPAGHDDGTLAESDLMVRDSEFSTSCATALLLDISHSMILYGEDRFTPAKQVALALTELIQTRYPRDTLDVILFGDEAHPVAVKDLPFAGVGPYHTNTRAGLRLARRLLERRKNPNKQILMVTDGKPTVIDVPGEGIYRNTFGLDERIVNKTLDEAVLCRRKGIPITTFMVADDPYLTRFIMRLTELNRGRAFFSSPEGLGGFVFRDFIRNRRGRAG